MTLRERLIRDLPASIAKRAIQNVLNLNPDPWCLDQPAPSYGLPLLLECCFRWDETPEKGHFWISIAQSNPEELRAYEIIRLMYERRKDELETPEMKLAKEFLDRHDFWNI